MNDSYQKDGTCVGLYLNACPIEFTDREIEVGLFPESEIEDLDALRVEHRDSHVVYREGHKVYCMGLDSESEFLGSTRETIRLSRHWRIVIQLLREATIRHFHGRRRILSFRPCSILGAGDLLFDALDTQDYDRITPFLSLLPRYELDFRILRLSGHEAFIALVGDVFSTWSTVSNCGDFAQHGYDLVDSYVGLYKEPSGLSG